MDFFDRQEHAQKRTKWLVWLFGLAVLAVVVLTYLILASIILPFFKPAPGETRRYHFLITAFMMLGELLTRPSHFFQWLWDARLACWITLGTLASIAAGCYYKIRLLSDGGPALAELLGGRCVEPNPSDLDEQRLRNVVEEMAIASGMPVPEIYVLDNERGINSFAAGHTQSDVAIGVTRGCLKLLTRDELQGVIAHEFSHVLNGDTRLNMLLIGLAHGLFWPTIVGRVLTRGTTQAPEIGDSIFDEDTNPVLLPTAPIGVLFLIVGSVSLPFVRLLKSAICRQREWLADAAAVQFTRNPAGITGALKKIGGLYKHGRLDTPHAETASHLYFAGLEFDPWLTFLSTHPPVAKRILAIDPTFDGQFHHIKMLPPSQGEREVMFDEHLSKVIAIGKARPEMLISNAGNPTREHIQQAAVLRLCLSDKFTTALRNPEGAMAVVYALLLSPDDATQGQQFQILQLQAGSSIRKQTADLLAEIQNLGDRIKLPLIDLALPALRNLEPRQYDQFTSVVQQLIECDRAIELFEYTLQRILFRHLRPYFDGETKSSTRYGSVKNVLPECATLLSALAHVGQDDEADARAAFAKGQEFLDAPGAQIQFLTRSEWDLGKVDAALARLAQSPPAVQCTLLLACGKTVAADNHVTEREAELLRAIADSLDCPLPPFVEALRNEKLTSAG